MRVEKTSHSAGAVQIARIQKFKIIRHDLRPLFDTTGEGQRGKGPAKEKESERTTSRCPNYPGWMLMPSAPCPSCRSQDHLVVALAAVAAVMMFMVVMYRGAAAHRLSLSKQVTHDEGLQLIAFDPRSVELRGRKTC